MWEMWAAVIAALGLAFNLARHNPERFVPSVSGALFVLWPVIGGLYGWDFALVAAQLQLKATLDPPAFAKAAAVLKNVTFADGIEVAALIMVIGLHVIKAFVGPKT